MNILQALQQIQTQIQQPLIHTFQTDVMAAYCIYLLHQCVSACLGFIVCQHFSGCEPCQHIYIECFSVARHVKLLALTGTSCQYNHSLAVFPECWKQRLENVTVSFICPLQQVDTPPYLVYANTHLQSFYKQGRICSSILQKRLT